MTQKENDAIYLRRNNFHFSADSGDCIACGSLCYEFNIATQEFKCLECMAEELYELSQLVCIPQTHLTKE